MSSNKRRGSDFERRVASKIRAAGLVVARAYASDGRSLGLAPEVDLLIDRRLKVQCKLRRQLATYIKPPKGIDIVIAGDRSGQYVVMRLDHFLSLATEERDNV